ncbi:hypothetical protein AK830_g5923 [Neonectria ditissima]|uniref:Uncharacterized protein n=1 Tax=Neonectria ditissima TaxID=78410 RepID=A0A0P7ASC2_9HYPO|nr:hypothetical protein AK830_g5923 [Neonectria ditissima]
MVCKPPSLSFRSSDPPLRMDDAGGQTAAARGPEDPYFRFTQRPVPRRCRQVATIYDGACYGLGTSCTGRTWSGFAAALKALTALIRSPRRVGNGLAGSFRPVIGCGLYRARAPQREGLRGTSTPH